MVPTLHIDRVQPGLYRVIVEGNGISMKEPEMVGSISEGLKFAGDDVPRDWAQYVSPLQRAVPGQQAAAAAHGPEQLAQELVTLMAEVMAAEESLQRLRVAMPPN